MCQTSSLNSAWWTGLRRRLITERTIPQGNLTFGEPIAESEDEIMSGRLGLPIAEIISLDSGCNTGSVNWDAIGNYVYAGLNGVPYLPEFLGLSAERLSPPPRNRTRNQKTSVSDIQARLSANLSSILESVPTGSPFGVLVSGGSDSLLVVALLRELGLSPKTDFVAVTGRFQSGYSERDQILDSKLRDAVVEIECKIEKLESGLNGLDAVLQRSARPVNGLVSCMYHELIRNLSKHGCSVAITGAFDVVATTTPDYGRVSNPNLRNDRVCTDTTKIAAGQMLRLAEHHMQQLASVLTPQMANAFTFRNYPMREFISHGNQEGIRVVSPYNDWHLAQQFSMLEWNIPASLSRSPKPVIHQILLSMYGSIPKHRKNITSPQREFIYERQAEIRSIFESSVLVEQGIISREGFLEELAEYCFAFRSQAPLTPDSSVNSYRIWRCLVAERWARLHS